MMRLLAHKRGAVVTVFALSAMVMAVMTALVVNQVTFYLGKRKVQAAVDLTALMMMRSGNLEDELRQGADRGARSATNRICN